MKYWKNLSAIGTSLRVFPLVPESLYAMLFYLLFPSHATLRQGFEAAGAVPVPAQCHGSLNSCDLSSTRSHALLCNMFKKFNNYILKQNLVSHQTLLPLSPLLSPSPLISLHERSGSRETSNFQRDTVTLTLTLRVH